MIIEFHFSYEASKENSPRTSKKSPDTLAAEAVASDNAVQRARAELRVLEQERSKLDKQRKSQLKDFETAKAETRRLLEVCAESCIQALTSVLFLSSLFPERGKETHQCRTT